MRYRLSARLTQTSFYRDPAELFEDFDRYSLLITEHQSLRKSAPKPSRLADSTLGSRRSAAMNGIGLLENWRTQCIEWCYNHYDQINDRFADQKYHLKHGLQDPRPHQDHKQPMRKPRCMEREPIQIDISGWATAF